MTISPAEAEADVVYQIGALKAFCDAAGVPLHHVKPHGALYNMAAKDPALAAAICRAVQAAAPGAVLLALSGSEMIKAAHAIGLPVASEVFADRGYQPDGTLVPRGTPGAMVEDEDTAIVRVLQMAKQGTVQANDGSTVTLQADSVCIHGDGRKLLPSYRKSPPPCPLQEWKSERLPRPPVGQRSPQQNVASLAVGTAGFLRLRAAGLCHQELTRTAVL